MGISIITNNHYLTTVWVMVFNATFNNISVSYNVEVSFIGGGNRSTWRKPQTCPSHKQTLSHNVVPRHERCSNSQL